MSKHLDGSPQPVDPIWYRHREWLHLGCTCGHRAALPIGETARRHGFSGHHRLYQLVDRMRCGECGAPPVSIAVSSRR